MGLEEKITLDLIKRWRSSHPQAEQELLFESGLYDAYHRLLYNYGKWFYRRLWRTNPWLPTKVEFSVLDVESMASGALHKVLGELKRRPEGFQSVEDFLDVLDKQTKRRLKDLMTKEVEHQQGTQRLDIPPDEEDQGEESETPLERLVGKAVSQTDPQRYAQQHQLRESLERLLGGFRQYLQRRPALQRHLDVLMMAFALCYPREEYLSLLARIFEFLNPTEKPRQEGRQHEEEIAQHVIKYCCRNRNTYDAAHNRRLRLDEWRKFADEDGKKDFDTLLGFRR